MKKTFYEKVGRRYKPVSEYDHDLIDSFPKGSHLVQCYPGGKLTRFNIDPAYAPMIAAGRVAEDAIADALRAASDLRPSRKELTESQLAAWKRLSEELGEEIHALTWPSAREAAHAAIKAMQDEADQLMQHDAVKEAFEQFLVLCELAKQEQTNG